VNAARRVSGLLLVLIAASPWAPARAAPAGPLPAQTDSIPPGDPEATPDSLAAPTDTIASPLLPMPPDTALDFEAFEDTMAVRLEFGGRADVTNEQYVSYEDAFVDTTFLVRQLVSTPERRYAGVLTTVLAGTRNGRATRYELRNDLSLGNLVQREALGLTWRSDVGPDWSLFAAPFVEYRHDRTFDRDRQELRGAAALRARRAIRLGTTFAEAGARLEAVRSDGEGSDYLLDRDAATLSVAFDHLGALGDDWRLDYGFTGRQFPDSASRDHLEQEGGVLMRRDYASGHVLALDGRLLRRRTVRPAYVSRDNYWTAEAGIEGDVRVSQGWRIRARADGEGIRYDVEDDTLYFDFHIVRGRLGLRFDADPRWNLTLGPRVDRLEAPRSPTDSYVELAGALELEILARGTWWSIVPAAGRRRYDDTGSPDAVLSSYDFVELGAFGDQALAGGLRLRGFGSWRQEFHDNDAQDARSLYVSVEVVWAPR
jgi:hypothetical protein